MRQYAQSAIKPGMSMIEIAELVEDGTRALVEAEGFESGIGFPTGVSLKRLRSSLHPQRRRQTYPAGDGCAQGRLWCSRQGSHCRLCLHTHFPAHLGPLAGCRQGCHQCRCQGRRHRCPSREIGASIQEVMESHEFEAEGKTHQVKCVQNLNGHSIERYSIHGGKSVPIVAMPDLDVKMEEGEYYAIETFGSTGRGYVIDQGECSHYARKKKHAKSIPIRVHSAHGLLRTINKHFDSLPFCRRYLDRVGEKNYLLGLKHLVSLGVVQDYPPLCDIAGR